MMKKRERDAIRGRRGRWIVCCCLALTALFAVEALPAAPMAAAQTAAGQVDEAALREAAQRSGLTPQEILRRAREAEAAGTVAGDVAPPPGRTELPGRKEPVVVLPMTRAADEAAADSLSAGEAVSAEPEFFGADFFDPQPGDFAPPSFGPVPRDYLLGTGDQIVVDVWGDVEFRLARIVERDGTIILPRGGKIVCANRTLEQTERAVREALARAYSGIETDPGASTTFVDVGLGELRTIRVFVVGDVVQPGAYELSSVASVFTALYAAGGPGDGGSFRDIRLVRGNEAAASLDIYDYLLSGRRDGDWILREGDTVLVPPRGCTVTLAGAVRRPLIFEMKAGETLDDLIRFGGGFSADAAVAVAHAERIVPPERREPNRPDREQQDLRFGSGAALRDGDVVTVARIAERLENWVEVTGNVKRPGRYQFQPGLDVASLVARAGGPWDDTLRERALLDRIRVDGSYESLEIPLGDVLDGVAGPTPLRPRDTLRIFSIDDVTDRRTVSVSGVVRRPGDFPWREGMTLRDLVLRAGGLKEGADRHRAEISRLSLDAVQKNDEGYVPDRTARTIAVELGPDFLTRADSEVLRPHDQVAIRELPWWELPRRVSLRGEVYYPGAYTLERPDERLSDLLARAGGLKPTAFPQGARIMREADGTGNVALDMIEALKHPGSAQDIILRQGDEILVPQVQHTVKIDGAVGFPTSIVWESGRSLGDYVSRAGGYAEGADKWKTRVVYPNGESRPIRRIWRDPKIMAGSTIMVPVKPPREGGGNMSTIKELAAIMASLATVYLVVDRTN